MTVGLRFFLRGLQVVALVLFALGLSVDAYGYQRSQTCGPPPNKFRCDTGEAPIEVFWSTKCVVIHLNEQGTQHLSFEEVQRVTELSAEVWSRVECSYLSVLFGGLTNEDRIGYNPYIEKNASVLVFRDTNWSHTAGILALTSVTFDRTTGEVVDADIEFNTRDFAFTSNSSQLSTIIDLQNTMVHEMGHLVGLDHTTVEDATMFASAPEGEIKKRSLHQDDIDGICNAYALAYQSESNACPTQSIGYFQAPDMALNQRPADDGCSIGGLRSDRDAAWLSAILALSAFVALRRKRVA